MNEQKQEQRLEQKTAKNPEQGQRPEQKAELKPGQEQKTARASEPEQKAEQHPEWKTEVMSVTGRGHTRKGTPCQDRTFRKRENGVTVIALADGAGSCPMSQYGAQQAVETASEILCRDFDLLYNAGSPDMVRQAVIGSVRRRIAEKAAAMGLRPEELSCTLLACAVKGDRYLLIHVGDGIIVCRKQGRLRLVSGPVNGEFANTTVFVTSPDAMAGSTVRRGREPLLEGFCLMSDGCENALYRKRDRMPAPYISRLMQQCQLFSPSAADGCLSLQLSNLIGMRTQDDCSLAFLTRQCGRFGDWDRMQMREKASLLGVHTGNRNRRRRQIRKAAARCM